MQAKIVEYLIRLIALLPLPVAHALGTLLGKILYMLPNSLKHPLKVNIDLCFPDLSPQQRTRLYRDSFVEMTRAAFETGALWVWKNSKILSMVKQVSGEELLEAAFNKGTGVILALPHLGCWELMSYYCSFKYPFTALYRPMRVSQLDPFIKQARQRSGATLVPINATGIRQLYKALARNELVAILPDQDPGKEGGVFVPFCGIQVNTMTLLPKLLQKTGATLLYSYAERLAHGQGYHIHFLPVSDMVYDADVVQAATHLNRGIETCIRQLPAQYQWAYKRFKTRPPGEPRLY